MTDWYSADPVVGGDHAPLRITVGPGRKGESDTGGDWWGSDPVVSSKAGDVVKSVISGIGTGAAGLIGLPGTVDRLVGKGVRKLGDLVGLPAPPEGAAPDTTLLPTGQDVQGAAERVTGKFYEPQTRTGEYAKTIGEFLPGAIAGPGGVLRNLLTFGVVPGASSEFAGSLPGVKGTAAEPWVRGATALGTGVGGAVLTAPRTTAGTVARAAEGVTPQQLQAAEQLFQEAQAMGLPLTRPEAIQYVTGGASNFGNLQRVVEGQGGMRAELAQRPAQVEAAAGPAFNQITPATPAPSTIGPAAGRAAEETINDVRGTINAATDPFYAAAATVRLTPQEMAQVRALPGYAEARDAVRNNPQLNRYVANLPEDSVGFLNEVKKYLDTAAENAAGPMNAQRNQQVAAGYGQDARTARQIGINASQEYQVALNVQEQTRRRFLEPLLQGPLGRLAERDITTKNAIAALFPSNPLPNSVDEIATAVGALAHRNPWAARQLVRAHAESTFNEATQNLVSGANEFGGAKFAAVIRGNPQQAANLEAAIRALPNGDQIYNGFNRFLTILEAQGTRQRIGSQTAFNAEVLRDLRQGKLASEAGAMIASGGFKLPTQIKDAIDRWRLGSNVDELARLFTDPAAGREFMRLASTRGPGPASASVIRLVSLAIGPSQKK